ncbi:DUF882 domain-containing protein [Rhizobium cremeum]|uniref:DUF882 domain-containing protein n=1 Tax=Rhizobium cremeum TaxID=2813827 RepID=UPI001FD0E559
MRSAAQLCLTVLAVLIVSTFMLFGASSSAHAETRTLKIHFVHTGEKAAITFKRNGRYDANGLKQLNYILRDWRRNQPTKMDPRLFDLVWEVYRRSGGSGYINVVSGYRSPETNSMLRSRSKGVAKESQHMRGTAMDFYIPGVQLKTLREIGMKMQVGGVGYYPNSGSPFVHMDVASVRAWPRMSRQELVRLFPDGKTLHIPADGKPLPGYQQALADYKQRASSNQILIAEAKTGKRKSFLAALFGGGGDEDEEEDVGVPAERPSVAPQPVVTAAEPTMVATAAPPPGVTTAQPVETAAPPETQLALNAPVPQSRPSLRPADTSLAVALYSPNRSAAEDALSQVAAGTPTTGENFADLQSMKVPVPTLLGNRGAPEAGVMTASIDPGMVEDDHIPLPTARPTVAEALLANADADSEAEVDEVEQAILSPEAAAALEQSNAQDDMPTPVERPAEAELTAAPATAIPAPQAAPVAATAAAPAAPAAIQPKPPAPKAAATQVASIEPKQKSSASRAVDFGDAFVAPKPAESGVEAGLPAKGGRPSKVEAEQARMAMTGGTPLTKNMLTQWALNKDRFETVAKPVKAPRIVSRSLTTPSTVYPVGFQQGGNGVDPNRFGTP